MFCHFCGIMGHDLKNCAQHYASRKNGVEKACQYGEWLKATNGQFRSLPKETPTNSKQTNNETVSQGLGGQGAAVVVVGEKQMEAPMERKSHANDDDAKRGSMESEENVPVTDVVIDGAIMGIVKLLSSIINTAGLISNSTQIPTITPTVHVGDMLTKLHAEHVSDNDQVGLQDSKHKPTWKRVLGWIVGREETIEMKFYMYWEREVCNPRKPQATMALKTWRKRKARLNMILRFLNRAGSTSFGT